MIRNGTAVTDPLLNQIADQSAKFNRKHSRDATHVVLSTEHLKSLALWYRSAATQFVLDARRNKDPITFLGMLVCLDETALELECHDGATTDREWLAKASDRANDLWEELVPYG